MTRVLSRPSKNCWRENNVEFREWFLLILVAFFLSPPAGAVLFVVYALILSGCVFDRVISLLHSKGSKS